MDTRAVHMHHVGLVVEDIEAYLAGSFWQRQSPIVYDPIQKARLCFACLEGDEAHLVELVQPTGPDSPTYGALTRRQSPHHICVGVPDLRTADELIRRHRLLPITRWQPAVLFDGRPIRFAYTRTREIVEFVSDEQSP